MEKILQYIERTGDGNYHCYSTKKVSLDTHVTDILDYDDKPVSTKKKSEIAETDPKLVPTVRIGDAMLNSTRAKPIFSFFLDGSRHVYKVDDIAISNRIFPILVGQIIVGCCQRNGRDQFKPVGTISPKIVIAMPDDFDLNDDGENFLRLKCENINQELSRHPYLSSMGISIDKILLYKTDQKDPYNSDKDNYKNRATAKIQAEMTDDEQHLVAELCRKHQLDDEHYLIKDGSLEYNPSFSNTGNMLTKENYEFVVGVSKSFNPELLRNYKGEKLSRTIAGLKPYERTKAYRYRSDSNQVEYAVWYLRLRNSDFRETNFSDIVKCEMVIIKEGNQIDTNIINMISANLINEAYPVCYGKDSRWGNHLYPVFLTESYCKSKYYNSAILLNIF